MAAAVFKMDHQRWESVADLARWLLTHADEFEAAIVCLRQYRREAGEPETEIRTLACPEMPIVEALGLLEICKTVYVDDART